MRVFGPVNSGYSTGMMAYTEKSDRWDHESELVDGYLNNMGAAYGDEVNWGGMQKDLFASALSETDVVIQPRQSNTWGPLSLDHVYEFMGGLSLTVKTLTGKEPDALMADYRNRNNKRMQNINEAIAVEARATVLNPTFVKERMKGGATTAQMFGEIFRNIFGWHATRPSAMDKEIFNDLYKMYIVDENLPHSLITEEKIVAVKTLRDGTVRLSDNPGCVKLAVVERHRRTGCLGTCLLDPAFGLRGGAIATSVSHDSHNVVVAGDDEEDMALAVQKIVEMQGGIVMVSKGKVLDALPLPVAGFMSVRTPEETAAAIRRLTKLAHGHYGISKDSDAFMTLSFLALPVIPHLKLTTKGLFDVTRFEFVPNDAGA